MNNIKRGTKVLVKNRQGGAPEAAVVNRREVVKSYYADGADQVWYHLVGWGVVVHASDVVVAP